VIIIVGPAPGFRAEINAAIAQYPEAKIMAINDAGRIIKKDYWCSCHPNWFDDIDTDCELITPETTGVINYGGTSGLFAAMVAVEYFKDEAILCGVPMDGWMNEVTGKPGADYMDRTARKAWKSQKSNLIGKVRSMSGWTKKLLNPDD
jgi:hypothetical protein